RILLFQGEGEQRIAGCYRNILPSGQRKCHRSGDDAAAYWELPQQLSVTSIERVEITFPASAEQQVRSSRQHACVGDIGHFELPLHLTRVRVNGADCAITFIFS